MSHKVKIQVKKKTSSPQPPMCLMAKGNTKVCEEDSDSDDELDPNEFANLIDEYTSVIKREKAMSRFLGALVSS